MLQLVTTRKISIAYHRIIPGQALPEEGPAPAAVLSVSPEQRHPPVKGHVRPIHTRQKCQQSVKESR